MSVRLQGMPETQRRCEESYPDSLRCNEHVHLRCCIKLAEDEMGLGRRGFYGEHMCPAIISVVFGIEAMTECRSSY